MLGAKTAKIPNTASPEWGLALASPSALTGDSWCSSSCSRPVQTPTPPQSHSHVCLSPVSQLKCRALPAALSLEPSKALSLGPTQGHPFCHDLILVYPVCIPGISMPWLCSVTFLPACAQSFMSPSPAVPFLLCGYSASGGLGPALGCL